MMQIYIDANGAQQYTPGHVSIDIDTGETVLMVIWDYVAHGGEIDLAKVGGYSLVNGELVYSQADFDANEALKQSIADNGP